MVASSAGKTGLPDEETSRIQAAERHHGPTCHTVSSATGDRAVRSSVEEHCIAFQPAVDQMEQLQRVKSPARRDEAAMSQTVPANLTWNSREGRTMLVPDGLLLFLFVLVHTAEGHLCKIGVTAALQDPRPYERCPSPMTRQQTCML